jgi:hypothetical protein
MLFLPEVFQVIFILVILIIIEKGIAKMGNNNQKPGARKPSFPGIGIALQSGIMIFVHHQPQDKHGYDVHDEMNEEKRSGWRMIRMTGITFRFHRQFANLCKDKDSYRIWG